MGTCLFESLVRATASEHLVGTGQLQLGAQFWLGSYPSKHLVKAALFEYPVRAYQFLLGARSRLRMFLSERPVRAIPFEHPTRSSVLVRDFSLRVFS